MSKKKTNKNEKGTKRKQTRTETGLPGVCVWSGVGCGLEDKTPVVWRWEYHVYSTYGCNGGNVVTRQAELPGRTWCRKRTNAGLTSCIRPIGLTGLRI